MAMWKVVALFNETKPDEEDVERTVVTEKYFDNYWDMRNYVTACASQGAVGGLVMKYHPSSDIWTYYMEVI